MALQSIKGAVWKKASFENQLLESKTTKHIYLLPYQDWIKIDLERSVCLHNIHC